MKYVGKLFGQIGRTRGYFDTGKTSEDWDALEARAERAEAELREISAEKLRWSILAIDRGNEVQRAEAELAAAKLLLNEETDCAEAVEAAIVRQYARAERAEASLHALRLVCGTTDADKFTTWVDRAIARAERAEAELTFQQERNSRLFEQRDAAVEAQDKAETALAATAAAPPPTAPSPTETRPN